MANALLTEGGRVSKSIDGQTEAEETAQLLATSIVSFILVFLYERP